MYDKLIDPSMFTQEIDGILNNLKVGVEDCMVKAVRKGCNKATKVAKANAPVRNDKETYKNSLSYRIDQKNRREVMGEVGSKTHPGLVHLLEKGHATIGGGRVAPREHMKQGFEEGAKVFEEILSAEIGNELKNL